MGANYWMGTTLARVCFSAFARWTVDGKEAVPPKGPLIVVSNHLSNADPAVLVASVPRRLHFLAKRGLFKNAVASSFLTSVGVHPVNREGADLDALRWNLRLLAHDQAIVLFPEGTRSLNGGMSRGLPGVAYIAVKSQAPILPVAITGTERINNYWRMPVPLCRLDVRLGDPFTLPSLEGKLSRPLLEHLTDMIMYRIAAMLPEDHRGYYAMREAESTQ